MAAQMKELGDGTLEMEVELDDGDSGAPVVQEPVVPAEEGKPAAKVVQEGNPDLNVTIVDDTPIEDRGRKPLGKDALAEEDDEAIQVNEKFKRRIGELRHQAHDERRAREAAERERNEAVDLAKKAMARAQQLEQNLTYGEASYATEAKEHAALAVAAARAKYRTAYEAGDPDALADAAAELSAAQVRQQQALSWAAQAERKTLAAQQAAQSALQQQQHGVHSAPTQPNQQQQQAPVQQQPQVAKPDERALAWGRANQWYGKDPVMTSLAYGVHEKLSSEGLDPVADADEYYGAIDAEMRRRFPEYEWNDPGTKPATLAKKAAPRVAPVTRSTSGKRTVTLTASQVALARRLNISNEAYARELLKLQGE